jgi:UDP-3-O-[3-hydroxymyristoyl] N-acetylglucosamine deacetylase
MAVETSIAEAVTLSGVGVHSGKPARIVFEPAPVGAGITFLRQDRTAGQGPIPAHVSAVSDARLGTTLRAADGAEAATVEHVLSACAGLGITNLRIVLDGPEAPIMDGSALPYAQALRAAGLQQQSQTRPAIEVLSKVQLIDGPRRAALLPSSTGEGLRLDVSIHFADPAIGSQRLAVNVTPDSFLQEIAPARTFGFLKELQPLRTSGRALGSSYDNTVVFDEGRVVNAEGLRFPDECVRHKMLDVLGDLALLGAPLVADCEAIRPGHALTVGLVRQLLETPAAWRWQDQA